VTRSSVGGTPERPFAHLAGHLTALRHRARLPQRALAEAASVSRGTVQRAESGTAAPSVAVLDAYLRACGAAPPDQARARLLRNRGRAAQRDRLRRLQAPHPTLIYTEDDLGAALAAAYERAGAPSLNDGRLTPGRTPLPRTTAWRIVRRKGLPASPGQLVTFLTACGIPPAEQRPYIDAYNRIIVNRGARPAPPSARRRPAHRFRMFPRFVEGLHEQYNLSGAAATLGREFVDDRVVQILLPVLEKRARAEAHRNGAVVGSDVIAAKSLHTSLERLVHYEDADHFVRANTRQPYEGLPGQEPPAPPPGAPPQALTAPAPRRCQATPPDRPPPRRGRLNGRNAGATGAGPPPHAVHPCG
jgi:transcriptional regulator with XRE-family HTH domain